MMPFVGPTG
jgi:hypothetical protein